MTGVSARLHFPPSCGGGVQSLCDPTALDAFAALAIERADRTTGAVASLHVPPLVLVGSSIAWAYGRGGAAWTRLSWIIGLQRAGVDVFVVDQLVTVPTACSGPETSTLTKTP